jgi:broad specificity phosphatase PhoE
VLDLSAREDTTILLTTHDLSEAEKLADRILILAGGRIIAGGSPEDPRPRRGHRGTVRRSRDGQHFDESTADATTSRTWVTGGVPGTSGTSRHVRASTTEVGMGTLWLVRHAESEGNLADDKARDAGAERLDLTHRDADMPLSPTGREQAAALGRAWRRRGEEQQPTRILSSPYERALQTATCAAEAAGWDHLELERDERLRERDLGMLDGFTKHGIEARFPEEAERRAWLGKFYYRPPGGESWADVAGRIRAVLEANAPSDHERLLVVSHQAVIMVARYVLESLTEQQVLEIDGSEVIANTALTTYAGADGRLRLRSFNDATHLDASDAPVTEEPDAASIG